MHQSFEGLNVQQLVIAIVSELTKGHSLTDSYTVEAVCTHVSSSWTDSPTRSEISKTIKELVVNGTLVKVRSQPGRRVGGIALRQRYFQDPQNLCRWLSQNF